jgi:hypothetical protein
MENAVFWVQWFLVSVCVGFVTWVLYQVVIW